MEEKNKINNEELKQVTGGDGNPKPDRTGERGGVCPVCGTRNHIIGSYGLVYDPVRGEDWGFWFWTCRDCNVNFISDFVTGEITDHVAWPFPN